MSSGGISSGVIRLARAVLVIRVPTVTSISNAALWRCSIGAAVFAATALVLPPDEARAQAQDPARPAHADPKTRGVIELMNQIETLNADLNRLRGQLEVLSNSLDNAQKRQRDMYLDLDTRLRRIEQAPSADLQKQEKDAAADATLKREPNAGTPAVAVAPPAGTGAGAGASPAGTAAAVPQPTPPVPPSVARPTAPAAAAAATSAASDPSTVRRAYDSALTIYRAGDYQGAVTAFDAFVKRYPKDPLAANAQYWIGDAWFNLRDFRAAAAAQQALISTYPDNPKVPDALLNLSSAQLALGDNAAAKKTLEDLVNRYPQTDMADKARQRLSKLK